MALAKKDALSRSFQKLTCIFGVFIIQKYCPHCVVNFSFYLSQFPRSCVKKAHEREQRADNAGAAMPKNKGA